MDTAEAMQSDEPCQTLCAFEESLQRLEKKVDWVPMGWQTLFRAARLSLRAVQSPERQGIVLHGAWEVDGRLYLDASGEDPVVHGILRKARVHARCTCSQCGRPGLIREYGEIAKTLCSGCAALHQLEMDMASLLRQRRMKTGLFSSGVVAWNALTPLQRVVFDVAVMHKYSGVTSSFPHAALSVHTLETCIPLAQRVLEHVSTRNTESAGL